MFVRLIPEDAPDADGVIGIPVGPPDISFLNYPLDVEIRLHNELVHRGLLTERDLRGRMPELSAALLAAWGADAHRVADAYRNGHIDIESA